MVHPYPTCETMSLIELFPRQRREPPLSRGESRGLNKERLRQCNEAPQGAGYQSQEAYPSGSHQPDEC